MKNIAEATASDRGMIESRIKGIIEDKLGVDADQIADDAEIKDHLGADSLDTIELIMEFEKEFDITIPDENAGDVKVVSDYYKLVAPHLY